MQYDEMIKRTQQIDDLRKMVEFLATLKRMSPEKIVITEGSQPLFNSMTLDGDRRGFLEECFAEVQSLCDDHIIMAKNQIMLLESDSLGMPTVRMGKKLVTKDAVEKEIERGSGGCAPAGHGGTIFIRADETIFPTAKLYEFPPGAKNIKPPTYDIEE